MKKTNYSQRTTIILDRGTKYLLAKLALEKGVSQSQLISKALRQLIAQEARKQAKKKLSLLSHPLGAKLDRLTRKDFYEDSN